MMEDSRFEQLYEALLDSFPEKADFKQMLRLKLNRHLAHIARDGNMREIVFETMTVAEREGWLEQLVAGAIQTIVTNKKLIEAAKHYGVAVDMEIRPPFELNMVVCAGFEIGRNPITHEQYARFIEQNLDHPVPSFQAGWSGRRPRDDQHTKPIAGINWHDAVAFCRWLSNRTGRAYRLPTVTEWKQAVQAGKVVVVQGVGEWTQTALQDEKCVVQIEGDSSIHFGYNADAKHPTFTFRIARSRI